MQHIVFKKTILIVFPNRQFLNSFLHDSICYLTYYLQFLDIILDTFIQYHYYHSQHHYDHHQGFYKHLQQIFRGTLESVNWFFFALFQSVWGTLMLQHYSTSGKVPSSYEWKSFFFNQHLSATLHVQFMTMKMQTERNPNLS